MMQEAINDVVSQTVQSTGRIIGTPLALRLVTEEFEKLKAINKEIEKVTFSESSVSISIKKGTSEAKMGELLMGFVKTMEAAYSKVIGQVARTMIKKSLEEAATKYGSKYKSLKDLAGKY
jgi:hypothetical protein